VIPLVSRKWITSITLFVKRCSMQRSVTASRPVPSTFRVAIICRATIELIFRLTSTWNTPVLRVSIIVFPVDDIRLSAHPSIRLVHTMCSETNTIRNSVYGYILSPAYPHPMADSLRCQITIGNVSACSNFPIGSSTCICRSDTAHAHRIDAHRSGS
jgi:hypothetical protein